MIKNLNGNLDLGSSPAILIMHRGGGLGDLLVSTCVSRAIAGQFPKAQISYLCSEAGKSLLLDCPSVDEVIVSPADIQNPWKLAEVIGNGRFDVAICLWNTWVDAWAAFIAGIPIRVGQSSRLLYSPLYTHKIDVRSERGDCESHWGEILLDYIRPLGIDARAPRQDYLLAESAVQKAAKSFADAGISKDEMVLGFHIGKGLSLDASMWPSDAFLSMARALTDAIPCRLLLTGSLSESPLVGAIADELGDQAVNVSGLTSIPELAGLISKCAAFICPDSFPMHLAAALEVPTVGIFALKSDFPNRWRPLCDNYRIVRPANWQCVKRCVKETCADFQCYHYVNPQTLVDAVLELLPESPRKSL